MKFIAITECPQGQQPGDEFEATEDAGNVLVLVGAARKADPKTPPPARGRYRRADLRGDVADSPSEA
jgi:hypothetical protein